MRANFAARFKLAEEVRHSPGDTARALAVVRRSWRSLRGRPVSRFQSCMHNRTPNNRPAARTGASRLIARFRSSSHGRFLFSRCKSVFPLSVTESMTVSPISSAGVGSPQFFPERARTSSPALVASPAECLKKLSEHQLDRRVFPSRMTHGKLRTPRRKTYELSNKLL